MKKSKFSERFKDACKRANAPASQEALGKYLGISGPMVSYLRNDERLPSARTGIKIASKLNVSYDWLMLGVTEMSNNAVDLNKQSVVFALRVINSIPSKNKQSMDDEAMASIFSKAYKLAVLNESEGDPITVESFLSLLL